MAKNERQEQTRLADIQQGGDEEQEENVKISQENFLEVGFLPWTQDFDALAHDTAAQDRSQVSKRDPEKVVGVGLQVPELF